MDPRQTAGALAGCIAMGLCVAARGIINPNFTPADLVRQANRIYVLEVSLPKDKTVHGQLTEAVVGDPPAAKTFALDLNAAQDLPEEEVAGAFGPKPTAPAVLLLRPEEKDADPETPTGFLQINTLWFAVHQRGGKLTLDRDKQTLFAVWAGSAPMLAEAARRVAADPGFSFPVRSDVSWGSDLALGKIEGKPYGCLMVDLGPPHGLCAVVLSDAGDRVYQAATQPGGQPSDITARTKVGTASRRIAPGDFDGDGRMDLASWDGRNVRVALQQADGTLVLGAGSCPLAECLSLDTLNVGGETPGLLVGTGKGPVLLIPVGKTSLVVRAVAGVTPETLQDLGTGGYCVAADFNADGRCDAMQLFEKGSLLFAGEAPGKFKPPVTTRAPLVRNPASAAPGDYDTDGRLDLVVAGEDGLALLSHTDARRLDNHTYVTGELAYHGNANAPNIHSAWACDINSDGRQGVALFGGGRKPLLFFNRGFACFGWARELDLVGDAAMPPAMGTAEVKKPELKSLESLQFGQKAAAVGDLNADGVTDLLGVDLQSNVWALFGQSMAERPLIVTLAFAPRVQDPVCVTVSGQKYRAGMYVVRPGIPATVGRPAKGVMNLQWFGPDGQPVTSKTMVTASKTVEIRAAAPAAP